MSRQIMTTAIDLFNAAYENMLGLVCPLTDAENNGPKYHTDLFDVGYRHKKYRCRRP